jgi:hypothetical protein
MTQQIVRQAAEVTRRTDKDVVEDDRLISEFVKRKKPKKSDCNNIMTLFLII